MKSDGLYWALQGYPNFGAPTLAYSILFSYFTKCVNCSFKNFLLQVIAG